MTEANPVQKTEKNDSVAEIRARRKQECALGYRLFAAHRWGDLGDGHISARDPEQDRLLLDVALGCFIPRS